MNNPKAHELDGEGWHLPFGAEQPEWCEHPDRCPFKIHAWTVVEAQQMRAARDKLASQLPQPMTKADLDRQRGGVRR